MTTKLHFLGISGSLRKASYNTAFLRAAPGLLPASVTMDIFDLTPIPLYNKDIEDRGLPEAVQDFRSRIAQADALIMSSPEYNNSVSGALKNAIDWASRKSQGGNVSVLYGKPLAISSIVTGKNGGPRGLAHLHDIAVAVKMQVLDRPFMVVNKARDKFDESGYLKDEATRLYLKEMLVSLKVWTLQLKGASV